MSWYGDYKPYVPVAKRRAQAAKEVARRLKNGEKISPVQIEGRTIAASFWGKAWGENLESYSDFENRLPRGRTYVRNGSVVHLAIEAGRIRAMVSGSELYTVQIQISPLPRPEWETLKRQCAGQVGTIVELLQGKLSAAVMQRVTDRDHGLFPKPQEIEMTCSCPDYAGMCKHVAAVMYGVGNRLDRSPELLFQLRGVNQAELITQAIPANPVGTGGDAPKLANADLGSIFGIEIDEPPPAPTAPPAPKARRKASALPATKPSATKPTDLSQSDLGVMIAARKGLIAEAERSLVARLRPPAALKSQSPTTVKSKSSAAGKSKPVAGTKSKSPAAERKVTSLHKSKKPAT